jgi:hypothetical protein
MLAAATLLRTPSERLAARHTIMLDFQSGGSWGASRLDAMTPRGSTGGSRLEATGEFLKETNSQRMEELQQIAMAASTADGVDWSIEELSGAKLVQADEKGVVVEEILCSAADNRCIAVDIPIPWPSGGCITRLPEMRAAFTEMARRAYAGVASADSMPPEYAQQQRELDNLMSESPAGEPIAFQPESLAGRHWMTHPACSIPLCVRVLQRS